MAPECLAPDQGDHHRLTKESDCYSFGMVIFEVLSGQVPFQGVYIPSILEKVLKGERPGRPQGAEGVWFTDDVWEMVEQCWSPQPERRPTARAVLEFLEQTCPVPAWLSHGLFGDVEVGVDTSDESYMMRGPGTFPHSILDPMLNNSSAGV